MKFAFIGAHPDDIEYGAGGLVARLKKEGHDVFFIVLTNSDNCQRMEEQKRASESLGAELVTSVVFADGKIETNIDAVESVRRALEEIKPEYVFTHWYKDTHQDHRATASIAHASCGRKYNLVYFESFSSIEFNPTVYVDISAYANEKENAINQHKSQIEKFASRNISFSGEALLKNEIYGLKNGVKYAEGFAPFKVRL